MKPHEWTDEGTKVLILRRCNADMTSHNSYVWPSSGTVTFADFNPASECGGGGHGWPWGMGLGDGMDYDIIGDKWLVIAAMPEDVVGQLAGGEKCKVRSAEVVFCGSFSAAWAMINSGRHRLIEAMSRDKDATHIASGNSSRATSSGNSSRATSSGNYSSAASSGDYSSATSSGNSSRATSSGNYSSAASSGDSSSATSSGNSSRATSSGNYSSAASSGDSSRATSSGNSSRATSSGNYSSAASSGDYSSAASSGDSSRAASSGDSSRATSSGNYSSAQASGMNSIAAVAGHGGRVSTGERGAFAIAYWTNADGYRFLCGKVGEHGIKADTWYEVVDGKLSEVEGQE